LEPSGLRSFDEIERLTLVSYNRSKTSSGGGAGYGPSGPNVVGADGFLVPDPRPRGPGSPIGEDGHANTRADGWSNPKGMGWLEGQLPPAGYRGAQDYTPIGPGSAAFANNPARFTTGDQRRSKRRPK
jgi:hypothetical protein